MENRIIYSTPSLYLVPILLSPPPPQNRKKPQKFKKPPWAKKRNWGIFHYIHILSDETLTHTTSTPTLPTPLTLSPLPYSISAPFSNPSLPPLYLLSPPSLAPLFPQGSITIIYWLNDTSPVAWHLHTIGHIYMSESCFTYIIKDWERVSVFPGEHT